LENLSRKEPTPLGLVRYLSFDRIGLTEIVREAVSNLEVLLEKTQGEVTIAELPRIEADRLQMLQIFQNLIGNGLKFHRKDSSPAVAVYAEQFDSVCQITMEDNGIGFDEKNLARIFVPFHRLHGRFEYEGTGMGLAICRKIAERHGGSITAKSEPGQGSKFIVTLPIEQPKK